MNPSDWYVDLPDGWNVARVIDHVQLTNGFPFDSTLFSLTQGMPLIRIRDIFNGTTEVRFAGEPVEEAFVEPGDILVGMDGDFNVAIWQGELGLLNQRVCKVKSHKSLVDKFLYYLLPIPLKIINELTYSTTVKHLSSFDILKIRFPYPPVSKQEAITEFLDRETARLDTLIAAKESLLSLLAEKRGAIITTTITRGIDPTVRLKESGIAWLGQVPEHWEIERAKWLFTERDIRSEFGDEEMLTVSHLTGVTPRAEKNVYMFMAESQEGSKICEAGDLVINTLWAWMGAMGVSAQRGIVSPAYNVYEPYDRLDPAYLDYLVRMPVFAQEAIRYSKGVWSSRLRLYPEGFYEMWLPVPPVEEQKEISCYLGVETKKIDSLQTATEHTVALLRERRSALIAAAVAGQLEVRG